MVKLVDHIRDRVNRAGVFEEVRIQMNTGIREMYQKNIDIFNIFCFTIATELIFTFQYQHLGISVKFLYTIRDGYLNQMAQSNIWKLQSSDTQLLV